MQDEAGTWALVLAAGEGKRLSRLTTASSGATIPKQYCSLYEGPSLLEEAMARGGAVTSRKRICAVVAAQHRHWWQSPLSHLPASNVIAQPANRGTANGILLPLLHILERDADARIVLLPSDHHVREEPILAAALRKAVAQLEWRPHEALLLGVQPEEPDPELGYIVPDLSDGRGALQVQQFVEKPAARRARVLVEHGALWNVFIVATTGRALLAMFKRRMPHIVAAMHAAIRADLREGGTTAVDALYDQLPTVDYSADILTGEEANLRVLPVPACGWSDLGTPGRVANVLNGFATRGQARVIARDADGNPASPLSLASEHARQSGHGEALRTPWMPVPMEIRSAARGMTA